MLKIPYSASKKVVKYTLFWREKNDNHVWLDFTIRGQELVKLGSLADFKEGFDVIDYGINQDLI